MFSYATVRLEDALCQLAPTVRVSERGVFSFDDVYSTELTSGRFNDEESESVRGKKGYVLGVTVVYSGQIIYSGHLSLFGIFGTLSAKSTEPFPKHTTEHYGQEIRWRRP